MCDQLHLFGCVCVCGRRTESVLEGIRPCFSGLPALERSNLDTLHLGSARLGWAGTKAWLMSTDRSSVLPGGSQIPQTCWQGSDGDRQVGRTVTPPSREERVKRTCFLRMLGLEEELGLVFLFKRRIQTKSLDVMNLPPATSADSCPGCFYEPEYRHNNSQSLLWRPCVWSRGANVEQGKASRRRRKKNMGDFLHDGSHHCRERSGEVEREEERGCLHARSCEGALNLDDCLQRDPGHVQTNISASQALSHQNKQPRGF